MTGQEMLSTFGGGDLDDVRLEIPSGYAPEARERVREYADRVTTGGWVVSHISSEVIWWEHPDPEVIQMYKIEKKNAGWHGVRRNRQVSPGYTEDLQEAIDGAAEYLADHPLRDVVEEADDD